ncbi:glycosyltransferase [Alcanivorax sp. S6407]|uniref:glycosyltransferase family 2 protein n=1 Tax=Alcanivorax sp. S6407 TaxID=2926424 RepID=UPI001FF43E8F|nr:glycosyltransferase [Alcanivorax sp. S6407]MCK0152802.1 glycosyltransferase [Alcanivorax sp. S6407]
MSKSTPPISVIIPIYQHWELTEGLFKALDEQTLPKDQWECFIVDNSSDIVPSQDSLPDFVTLLECPTPGSYAARNKALTQAKGELLVFTDADCQPEATWLEKIWTTYQAQSTPTLIAGGVTVKRFKPGKPNAIEVYDTALGLPQARYIKDGWAVTANLSIPRSVFEQIGTFDDQRFSGGDSEFCLRAKAAGTTLVYLPEANVNHPARNSWKEITTKMKRVRGGQVLVGPAQQRGKYLLKTLSPPIRGALYAINSGNISRSQKWTALWVIAALWALNIWITITLMVTGKMERQ